MNILIHKHESSTEPFHHFSSDIELNISFQVSKNSVSVENFNYLFFWLIGNRRSHEICDYTIIVGKPKKLMHWLEQLSAHLTLWSFICKYLKERDQTRFIISFAITVPWVPRGCCLLDGIYLSFDFKKEFDDYTQLTYDVIHLWDL